MVMKEEEEDRISNLPKDIIHHILSYLTIEDSVSTSVLSKRWRYQWTFNPNIVFPNYWTCIWKKKKKNWSAAINQCLKLYQSQQLNKLHIDLNMYGGESPWEIWDWIDFAVKRKVRNLSVDCSMYNPVMVSRYLVPKSLFSCQSLQVLVLAGCNLYPPTYIQCIESLRSLCLKHVKVFDGAIESLLSKCERLKRLTLEDCIGITVIKISLPQLQRLEVGCSTLDRLEICTPSLRFLTCTESIRQQLDVKNNVPNIIRADLSFRINEALHDPQKFWGSTMESMSHMKILDLQGQLFKSISEGYDLKGRGIVLNNLKELHLRDVRLSLDTLASFFRCCPVLEQLFIEYPIGRAVYENKGSQSSDTDSFLLEHLKLVQMIDMHHEDVRLMALVKFLLEKAVVLEEMLIVRLQGAPPECLLMKIFDFPKASPNAKIVHRYGYTPT